MIKELTAGALLGLSAIGGAYAQAQPDTDYEKSRSALQAAIHEAAGSTRAAIVLPVSALENPAIAQSISSVVKDPESSLALEGYDPVGYFTEGEAMLGDPAYQAEYDGAVFYFASAEHRAMFIDNPERYAPAFGGYCTETLANGALTPASPLHWTVHGDRLYLTRSAGANKAFREHRGRSVEASDKYWMQADLFLTNANFSAVSEEG